MPHVIDRVAPLWASQLAVFINRIHGVSLGTPALGQKIRP